jgi:hypothetical protein
LKSNFILHFLQEIKAKLWPVTLKQKNEVKKGIIGILEFKTKRQNPIFEVKISLSEQ